MGGSTINRSGGAWPVSPYEYVHICCGGPVGRCSLTHEQILKTAGTLDKTKIWWSDGFPSHMNAVSGFMLDRKENNK